MFSIVYGLFNIFERIGWNIEYNIDKIQSKKQAIKRGSDIYLDKKGKQKLVNNDQSVTTYRNMNGDVMRLDLKGNIVSIVSKHKDSHHEYKTVEKCIDEYGNNTYWLNIDVHKNFNCQTERLKDIDTGEYLALKEIRIEDKWEKRHGKYSNYGRTHRFYMNPYTLELVRESDGEVELRNKGYKNVVNVEAINQFITDYNRKLYEDYEPKDKSVKSITWDYTTEKINELLWYQNRKEKEELK